MSIVMILVIGVCLILGSNNKLSKLPKPEVTGGERGTLGIDKYINEETIDNYLNRSDSVYRDMRMLKDPGNYEAIGGDSYLSGFIKGFEVIPYPYLTEVKGLPKEVGESYKGKTMKWERLESSSGKLEISGNNSCKDGHSKG